MKALSPIFNHPTLHLLQRCTTIATLHQIHAHMITTGLILHTYPCSRILFLSSTLATSLSYALTILNHIPNPTIFLFNTLISSLLSTTHINPFKTHVALSLYNRILTHPNLRPNNYTYPSLFKACGSHPWLRHGRALHTHVLKFLGSTYDHFVKASLLNFYSQCGQVGIARYLFDQVSQPDSAIWNSILSAYAQNARTNCVHVIDNVSETTSLSLEVMYLFTDMQKSLVRPDEVTLVALISACADLGALSQGVWAHAYVLKNNLKLNRFVVTCLITMYSNCGCLDLGCRMFDELPKRDTFCYNAMIRGFGIHGHGHKALETFKQMILEGLVPDDVTIVVTMCACSHVGLVDEGCKIFESMKEEFGLEPKLEHYCCLVDLLGRAGQIKEAEEIIRNMPMKPNAILWRSLLGAARVHDNLKTGEVALKHLIELESETSGNYVLLSNIYASTDRWDDVKRLRRLMKDHCVDKMPGSSIVDIDGTMHEFLIGDKSHPQSTEIYFKLEEINRKLQESGHKPRTKEVLFDIEEEDKEDALSYHSERLAIAFALMVSESSSIIRIIKNLRVCTDCHVSTKLISKIYRRQIIVRDRNRFHHFKDGTCSCLDYW